jgi:hypothetical protein
VRLIEFNPFFKLCARFGEWFALRSLWCSGCESFLSYYVLRRLGEIIFLATFPLVTLLLYYIIFWTCGCIKYFPIYSLTLTSVLIAAGLYFCLHLLSELDCICGGLEVRAADSLKP